MASVVGAGVVLIASHAAAHARLVRSSPPADAVVSSPRTIVLTFNERMIPAFSAFDVTMTDGLKIPMTVKVSGDGKSLSGTSPTALAPGAYIVNWHAATADGHRMTGALTFKVN